MDSNERGISIEGLIAIFLGFLLALINPEQAFWRICILASMAGVLLNLVRRKWTIQRNPILTLTGKSSPEDEDTFLSKFPGYVFATLLIVVIGVVTWPTEPFSFSGDAVILPGAAPPPIQYIPPTPKGILPSPPVVQPGPVSNHQTGRIGVPPKAAKPQVPAAPAAPSNLKATAQ
jgi:hypothetical protein